MAETRTRRSQSAKQTETEQENTAAEQRKAEAEAKRAEKAEADKEAREKREAERKEREEKRAAEKAERDERRAEEKAQREKEREEAKAAKEQEKIAARQADIDAGNLIFANFSGELVDASDANGDFDGFTFQVAEPKKEEVAQRALSVIIDLQNDATEVPMAGKELADKYLGGTVQWVAFFGMLRVIGWVKAYRFKTGERGQSGLAYLWTGPTKDEIDFEAPAEELAEEEAAAV